MYPYRGGGGGIQVHCIWYNRCDNIWLLFSLAGTQTHVWIDLATGCTSIVFFFGLLQILLVHVCHSDAYVKHFFL